jgi:Fic family protein
MCMCCCILHMMDATKPANDLLLLPPRTDLETRSVLRKAISANRELAKLKGYGTLLPNETILLNTVVLKEARASSEIENIVTTQDELYRAMVAGPGTAEPETKEVLNYRAAMWKGYALLQKTGLITTRTILAIQAELEGNSAGIRSMPGTELRNDQTGEVIYTPPDNEKVIRDLLANLEQYINTDADVDPLVRMAVAHYQFEAIHPFYDGNGRAGRILNVLFLVRCGLLDSPILYLSRYIIRHKPAYYELLQAVRTDKAWTEWIEFMLEAVEATSTQTLSMTRDIVSLMEKTSEQARASLPRTTYSRELVELLFSQPYVKIEHLVAAGIAERRTASKYLKQIEEMGVLRSYQAWRETVYINQPLIELLEKTDST